MKHRSIRSVTAGCLIAAAALTGVASSISGVVASADDDSVVFTVGVTQDIDTLNVTAGYLVIDYEIWNLTLPTLTDKASADFAVQPSLAESWEGSDDGLTWTYKLKADAKWSDGEPMTADDVVYTITRSVEEGWFNHLATTGNLTATATDPSTVVITSSAPDPKLPVLDFYIVPKHIYESIDADALATYPADDNVSGGPFMITERSESEFVKLERNPNWYGEQPKIDQVIYRIFATPEAQYTALVAGEIDAIDDTPANLYADVVAGKVANIEAIGGNNGSFSELAMNNGCSTGIGDGHPALQDKLVRQAINWAIDRDLLIEKTLAGTGVPAYTIIPSANPAFDYKIPDGVEPYSYAPDKAKALLDEAGWTDDDGNGVRERDGVELRLRYFDRSVGTGTANTGFITDWLDDVGIATDVSTYDEDTLTALQGKGEFDLFTWGWSPFVDPDFMMSYMTTANVPTDPDVGGYNDANWCNADYDALYDAQHIELDPDKRAEQIQQAMQVFYDEAPYAVLYKYDLLMSIRSDRWTNLVRQPSGTGPVLFNQGNLSYLALTPKDGGSEDSGSNTGLILGIVGGVVVIGAAGLFAVKSRRKSADDDRE